MRSAVHLFRLLSSPAARSFARALRDPERATARLKARLAAGVARTQRGAELGVRSAADWERLPLVNWEELEPWISRQSASSENLLLPDPAVRYEKTSGSTGRAKLVPHTRPLLNSFTRMFLIWAHDLVSHGPSFRTGRVYFSVSPRFDELGRTASGTPIGTADDRDYLTGWSSRLFRPFWVQPSIGQIRDPDRWRRALAEALADETRLEVISVWNPSFLLTLLDTMQELGVDAHWPELKLVSCWDAGHAAPLARQLRRRLPGVLVQGKGLLATEAPITVPLHGVGAVPLIDQTLIELEDDRGNLHPVHQVDSGQEYGVVISQQAGLVRYRIGDRVRVSGWYGRVPLLEFVGRGDQVVDLVGEKLNRRFVEGVLDDLAGTIGTRTLVPVRDPDGYVLLADGAVSAHDLEAALLEAHHYAVARALRQLAAVRVVHRADAAELLLRQAERRGQARGGSKPTALLPVPADAELRAALGCPP